MKLLTMYLPQFHRVKENDQWWGEGFTDWIAVQQARPLFEGHKQPRIPYRHNYYDLLKKDTMKWQSELMREYGIYGQVFYHYWFADGKKILEKPAENLLRWKDVDMPFCFSWANETWARSWSKLSEKNTWSSRIDTEMCEDSSEGVLLQQNYGDEASWREHFEYLSKFFRDDRYIKKDGKPVFIIYKPDSIPCLVQMLDFWRKLAEQTGFAGIYMIGVISEKKGIFDAVLWQEPQYTIRNSFKNKKLIEGNDIWRQILSRAVPSHTYLCGFSGYDDTPRRGEGGKVVLPVSVEAFKKYMTGLLAKSKALGNEFVFVNAWNEWGESMYLEPDQENGFGMLQAIKAALQEYDNAEIPELYQQTADYSAVMGRYKSYWYLMDKWLTMWEDGRSLAQKLLQRGYHTIALYGLGMLGLHAVRELENSPIQIKYGIDRRGKDIKQTFPVLREEDAFPEVDAVIVSVTYDFGEIYHTLKSRLNCPILSLEEIIMEER